MWSDYSPVSEPRRARDVTVYNIRDGKDARARDGDDKMHRVWSPLSSSIKSVNSNSKTNIMLILILFDHHPAILFITICPA
jgi:hypothetical protein